jgi:predicted dehydrogenase
VLQFESRYERWRPHPRPGSWRDQLTGEEGGGVLADLGSHVIDQALQLFGRPTTVYAEIDHRRPGSTGDDDAFIALDHLGGVRSHLWASQVASIPGHRMRVLGSAGGYGKHEMDVKEEALRNGVTPGSPGWGEEPEDHWGLLVTESGQRRVKTVAGDWSAFYRAVAAALRDGSPPPVEPSSAVEVLEVIEAAKASAKARVTVTLAVRPPANGAA